MSRSNRDHALPEFLRPRPDYGGYSARRPSDGNNRMPSLFPPYLPAGSPPDFREGDLDPRSLYSERIPGGPLGISSFPARPHFHNHAQFLNNDSTRNTRLSRPAADVFPSLQGQPSLQATEERSKLSPEVQKNVLSKLKKVVYIPMPKLLTRKPSLYYRDNPLTISRELPKEKDEEGKRCAICLDDFEPKEVVTETPCKHMFHEECILPWVKSEGRCPVCRFAISERFKETAAAGSSNVLGDDHFELDLNTIMRAMEEAFVSGNLRQIL